MTSIKAKIAYGILPLPDSPPARHEALVQTLVWCSFMLQQGARTRRLSSLGAVGSRVLQY